MEKPEERLGVERLLALSRIALSVACLVPVWTGASGLSVFRGALLPLILGYTIFGVVVLAALEARWIGSRVATALRLSDVAWGSAIALLSRGALLPLPVAMISLGWAAEAAVRRSARASIAANLLAGIQSQRGFRLAMKYVAAELMRLTASDAFLVAVRELDSDRALLWSATRRRGEGILLLASDLPRDRQRFYLFDARGDAWSIPRRQQRGRRAVTTIDNEGHVVECEDCDLDVAFWQYHQHQAALAIGVSFGGTWRGRLFLLRDRPYSLSELRVAQRLVRFIMPALHTHYLWRRLRSHAAAERRHARAFDAGRGQIVPTLSAIVERFERDNGIRARFYAGPQEASLPPRAARKLASALQDALINVQRHAHASKVDVEFRADAAAWRLDIENDGRPFKFLGRLSLQELEARRLGPRDIKERVRDMGGDLTIESSPTAGVRLEISLPRHEEHSKSA